MHTEYPPRKPCRTEKCPNLWDHSTGSTEFTIFTDASTQGWGTHMGDSQIAGVWTHSERELHINVLERRAVILALNHWAIV